MIFDKNYNVEFCKQNDMYPLTENIKYNDFCYPNNNFDFGYSLNDINFTKNTLFTTGIGMNREPHLLTALQLLNIIKLQQQGYHTQIVLGDFDVMLARGSSNSKDIAEKYKCFLERIGYDTGTGTIRTQYEFDIASRNAILLSSYIDYNDFSYVKEDIVDYYGTKEYEHDFATLVSISLMVSDFLTPILTGEFENVVVCSGLDESKYAVLANTVLKRMGIKGIVGGLFTSVIGGLNNHPKMSKSKPESCILLSDSPEKIVANIVNDKHKTEKSTQCKLAQLFLSFEDVNKEEIRFAYSQYDITGITRIEEKLIKKISWLRSCWLDANK